MASYKICKCRVTTVLRVQISLTMFVPSSSSNLGRLAVVILVVLGRLGHLLPTKVEKMLQPRLSFQKSTKDLVLVESFLDWDRNQA